MSRIFTDQMQQQVKVQYPPRRIVSLVPSQTELLFDLGLDEQVVGITKFCIHPIEKWQEKPRIGGTKKLHLDKIAALYPDLVIGNKEENERLQIEALKKTCPVWMSDVRSFQDALAMIEMVGELVGIPEPALELTDNIRRAFESSVFSGKILRTAYFIWRNPWMVAAADTFIDNMMRMTGFENVFSDKTRYPEITLKELDKRQPEVVLLSSEPYPFRAKHAVEIKRCCPTSVVAQVDGEMFSWYGSRLLKAARYFVTLRNDLTHVFK